MNKILKIALVCFFALSSSVYAASIDEIQSAINGKMQGCTENAVTTTGHNRSSQLAESSWYLIYGYDSASLGTFDVLQCATGNSSINVNSLPSSMVGEIIGSGTPRVFYTGSTDRYVSCISATSGMKYALCKLN